MTFYFQQILDEGTSNPIVARTHVQWSELLELCRLDKDREFDAEKKDDLRGIFFDVMKAIFAARKGAVPLIEELQSIDNNPKDHGLNWEAHKKSIPAALKLDDVKVFLKHTNECLKLLAQALSIFFGKGWTEAKFEPILEYVKGEQEKVQENWQLVELLQKNILWLKEVVELRNIDEHKFYKRQKKKVLFENYSLLSNGDLIRPKLHNGQEVLAFLIDGIERLFLFSEMLIVSTIELYLPEPIIIEEIPSEMRRKECPKRFKYGLGYFSVPPVG